MQVTCYRFNVKAEDRVMLKTFSAATALVVTLVFLLVSITHACSGLGPMGLRIEQSSMNRDMGNVPCGEQKTDICKSVRDSILCVKPSVSEAVNPRPTLTSVQLSVDSPALLVFSPVAPVIEGAYHPVFKVPLTVSYLVLRI